MGRRGPAPDRDGCPTPWFWKRLHLRTVTNARTASIFLVPAAAAVGMEQHAGTGGSSDGIRAFGGASYENMSGGAAEQSDAYLIENAESNYARWMFNSTPLVIRGLHG